MANYATLKTAISQVIKENGNKEITGAVMQTTLLSMVDSIASGYTFAGVATPSTSAGTPDENVFWIGGAGSYSNFGATTINVPTGSIVIFKYNGTFSNNIVNIVSINNCTPEENKIPSSIGAYETSKGFLLEQGGLNGTTGEEVVISRRLRTSFIKLDSVFSVFVEEGIKFLVYFYDNNKNFLRKDADWISQSSIYDKQDGYIRVVLAKTNDNDTLYIAENPYLSIAINNFDKKVNYLTPISFGTGGYFDLQNGHLITNTTVYAYVGKEQRKTVGVVDIDLGDFTSGMQKIVLLADNSLSLKAINYILGDNEYLIAHLSAYQGVYMLHTAGDIGVEKVNSRALVAEMPRLPQQHNEVIFINHRGVTNEEFIENTAQGVMFSAMCGVKYIQGNVCYTSDGVAVMMHDDAINRTMVNLDGSPISTPINVSEHTYSELLNYKYNSGNVRYQTKICTLVEYIDACACYGVIPKIVSGTSVATAIKKSDIQLICSKLGSNWFFYGGIPSVLREVTNDVLFLSISLATVTAAVADAELRRIGGRCGLCYTDYEQFVTDWNNGKIKTLKTIGYEIEAAFTSNKVYIPYAIEHGCSIILSSNIGKKVNEIEANSLVDFNDFSNNGTIVDAGLSLANSQTMTYELSKKGIYNIYMEIDGEGSLSIPYDDEHNVVIMLSGDSQYIMFPVLFTSANADRIMTLTGSVGGLTLKNVCVKYEEN